LIVNFNLRKMQIKPVGSRRATCASRFCHRHALTNVILEKPAPATDGMGATLGIRQQLEHKDMLCAELGADAPDRMTAVREADERAIYDCLKADLLCKVPGAVTRLAGCNSAQLGDIAAIVMLHWDDAAAAGRLVRQRFNAWMWETAQEEAAA
jgi:hypothetical protein